LVKNSFFGFFIFHLSMKKAGEVFIEERKKKGFFLEEVIKKTKIPKSFLLAIESGNYSKLPGGPYPDLYVRRYARFLGLSEKKLAAIFRRDYLEFHGETKKPLLLKIGFVPQWRAIFGVGTVVLIFAGYLFYQYFNFVYPPKIKTEWSKNSSGDLVLEGKTDSRATLLINDRLVEIDQKGNFSYRIREDDGDKLYLSVESPSGKTRTMVKEIDGRN